MTTIATDGKSMAGDGLACVDGTATTFDRVKVRRLPDGSLLGCAGDSSDIIAFREWLGTSAKRPRAKDFAALHLHADGVLDYYGDAGPPSQMNVPAAIGSGCLLALGAMEAGASPEQAVRIAARRDIGTGGTVIALKLYDDLPEGGRLVRVPGEWIAA